MAVGKPIKGKEDNEKMAEVFWAKRKTTESEKSRHFPLKSNNQNSLSGKDMVKILHHLGSASSRYALASVFSSPFEIEYG